MYKVAIIWWTSNFWKWWEKYFKSKNNEVIVSSRTTKILPKKAVKLADIIIVSVPIRHTVETVKELIPYIWENKLLIDFTWIKLEVIEELKKYNYWEIISVHPMFWPWIDNLKEQNISYDPIKEWEKWEYIKTLFKNDWANLFEIKSEKHDEFVSIVQSSVHIINSLLWNILKKRWINLEKMMEISTPNSRMQLYILSRFLKQNASLYTDMQMHNKLYKEQILPDMIEHFQYLNSLINNNETEKFEKEFNDIKNYLWEEFINKSFEKTKKIDSELKK